MKKLFLLFYSAVLTVSLNAQSLQEAIKYTENEQYTRAKSMLNALIKSAPTKPDAYFYLGNVYLKLEIPDSALVFFNKAKEVDPKFNLGLVGAGAALYQKGKKAEAKASFDQALLASKSKNAEVLARIAEVYVEAKDKKELDNSIALLDKAIFYNKLVPDYFLIRGDAFLAKQDGSKAVTDYHEASRLDPKLAKAYIKEGKLYIKARNYSEAMNYYDKGISMNPEFSPAYREKGELFAKMRKYDKALETYKKYMELSDDDNDTKFRYASFLFMTQDYKGSKELINKLFANGYASKIGFRLLGYSDFELKDSVSSVMNLEKFFKETDSSKYIPSDYTYYGKALIKTGKTEEGFKALVKAFEMDSTNNDLLLELAETANKLKDTKNTIYYYSKASTKFKPRFNDLFNLGKAYYFEKRYAEADTTFGSIIAKYPQYPYGFTWKANTKATQDPDSKLGLAKPYFEKVVELFNAETVKYKSDLTKAYNYLGAYYQLVAKDNVKAAENWNKLLVLEPENKQAKDALTILNQGKK